MATFIIYNMNTGQLLPNEESEYSMNDYFIPLGGADEIGASSYFLSVDGINILLDCGARLKENELFPDYERILQEIDYSEIDFILISHAHFDHIGSLASIATRAENAEIITTQDTKTLISMQLLDLGRVSNHKESERIVNERLRQTQLIISRIHTQPVMRPIERRDCRITFMPAGHMPGAVMIYIESRHHSILYSGDFSIHSMFGVNGMRLLTGIAPDTLLLNAPNTYMAPEAWTEQIENPERFSGEHNNYAWLVSFLTGRLQKKQNIYLYSRSIPRHLDLFYFLRSAFPEVPVVLEPKSRSVADKLSDMGYFVYGTSFRETPSGLEDGYIVVGQNSTRENCVPVSFDCYSLHATPVETLHLVQKICPHNVFLLHVKPDNMQKSLVDVLRETNPDITARQAVNGTKYYIRRKKTMKHIDIFQRIMDNELARAREEIERKHGASAQFLAERTAICGSILYPNMHPRDAYQNVKDLFSKKETISYSDYITALGNVNLDTVDRRLYLLHRVEQGIAWLKQALDGDTNGIEKFADFTENLSPREANTHRLIFIGKCAVIFAICIDPDLKNEKYLPICIAFGAPYCNRLLRNLRNCLMKEYGIRRKRSAQDVLSKTKEMLDEASKVTEAAESSSKSEIEKLQFENNNYKSSLEAAQSMFDELWETLDENAEEAKRTAILSFYSMMNSEKYGNLLDSVEFVEKTLAELKAQKFKTPAQLKSLTIVFRQLARFIKDCGIKPIDTTGREFTACADDLDGYEYIGNSYANEEERTVIVEHPGWKFENMVISKPVAREKEEEEGV